jgi:hypothetical protein
MNRQREAAPAAASEESAAPEPPASLPGGAADDAEAAGEGAQPSSAPAADAFVENSEGFASLEGKIHFSAEDARAFVDAVDPITTGLQQEFAAMGAPPNRMATVFTWCNAFGRGEALKAEAHSYDLAPFARQFRDRAALESFAGAAAKAGFTQDELYAVLRRGLDFRKAMSRGAGVAVGRAQYAASTRST